MQKTVFLIAFMILINSMGYCQTANLTICVDEIRNTEGNLMIGVFDNPHNFKTKSNPCLAARKKITDNKTDYTFSNVPLNIYAVAIFHDENGDDTLNTKALGIPTEGIGFSGKLQSKFKPPAFGHILFKVTQDTTIYIKMIYPKSAQKKEK